MDSRLLAASYALRTQPADLARIGIAKALSIFESSGGLQVVPPIQTPRSGPPLNLDEKTRARMAELDDTLRILPGHGIAESILSGALRDLMEKDPSLILDGWEFEDPEAATASAEINRLAERWRAEDAAELMSGRDAP